MPDMCDMTNISRWLLAEVERLRAERDTYREALRALVEATEEQWRVTRCLPHQVEQSRRVLEGKRNTKGTT